MEELSNFRKKLLAHQLVFENIPLIYQLGIPKLYVEHGQLCMSFFPHKVTTVGDEWRWDYPTFQLTCTYPSCKILHFANRNYGISGSKADNPPPLVANICRSESSIRKLEKLCSEVMGTWIDNRACEDVLRFEKERKKIAEQLGLSSLWGE